MTRDPGRLRLAVLAGDGIGPEVTEAALRVLKAILDRAGVALELSRHPIGGTALDTEGDPLPETTSTAALGADAILVGAVGGPSWDSRTVRPEQGLLRLRVRLGAFANLRPVRVWPGLESRSPLRAELVRGANILFVRELTGGSYFGEPRGVAGARPSRRAVDTSLYSEAEIRRVALVAFEHARRRRHLVTSVDKANVLATSGLWRQVVTEVGESFPDVVLQHQLVDSFALSLLQRPTAFDVVVTENLFGDILTDEAAALVGSVGVLPSASGNGAGPWLYEPIHGSAPGLEGRGMANPLGAIACVALLLRYTLRREDLATSVEQALASVIATAPLTTDLGGEGSSASVTQALLDRL